MGDGGLSRKLGKQTVRYLNPPVILASATVVGPREGAGPLGSQFDVVKEDHTLGEKTWEKAERRMLEEACALVLRKARLRFQDVDLFLAGDLLNQIISANYAARTLGIPFLGIYGACSTLTEALALGGMLVDGGFAGRLLLTSSSHYMSAERQYRYPTEFATQRPPTAQWTVTGAGAILLGIGTSGVAVTSATVGKVIDAGMSDPNDMGSAMAPAAAEVIYQHFCDTGADPTSYDVIVTGDLGKVGSELLHRLLAERNLDLRDRHLDCGVAIYSDQQDPHAGGSGCACIAVVFAGPLLRRLEVGRYNRMLLVATGALFSPVTWKQGESIPCIAHAVAVERREG